MDIKALLDSGLLEVYVLGHTSPEESLEILRLAGEYPEIREEINRIEEALESFALAHAVEPPAWVKGRIVDQVRELEKESDLTDFINKPTQSSPIIWSLLLMGLILAGSMVFFYSRLREKDKKIYEQSLVSSDCIEKNGTLEEKIKFLLDTGTKTIEMAALPGKNEDYKAVVLYNESLKMSYLKTRSLPVPPAGKDFQLWALISGQPVSLGVLPADLPVDLLPVIHQPDAAAFAVSLEPDGGSSTPTEVIMLGNTTE